MYSTGGSEIGGFSLAKAVGYAFLSIVVMQAMNSTPSSQIENDIVQGDLTLHLIKPYNYLITLFCQLLPKSIIFLALGYSTYIFCSFIFPFPSLSANTLLLIGITLVLSYIFTFLFYTCIGLISFWVGRSSYFRNITAILILVFGGGFFPLTWFGEYFYAILRLFPFQYVVYIPVALSVGALEQNNILEILLIEFFWLIIILFITVGAWKKGIKRFDAPGG